MSHITNKQKADKLRRSIAETLAMLQRVESINPDKIGDTGLMNRAAARERRQAERTNWRRRVTNLKRQVDYFSRKLAELEGR